MDLSAEHFSLQYPDTRLLPPAKCSSRISFYFLIEAPSCTQSPYLSHVQLSPATPNIRSALCLKYNKKTHLCHIYFCSNTREWLHVESKCKLWKAAPSTSNNSWNDTSKFALFLSEISVSKMMCNITSLWSFRSWFSASVWCSRTHTHAHRGGVHWIAEYRIEMHSVD